ncbi:hypothetical protein GCM10025794_36240 [Massilia kyonggiensis]
MWGRQARESDGSPNQGRAIAVWQDVSRAKLDEALAMNAVGHEKQVQKENMEGQTTDV